MLTNNKLLIDQDCPMCGIYAKFFVKSGCVDSTTIVFYQTVPDEVFNQIDKKEPLPKSPCIIQKRGKLFMELILLSPSSGTAIGG